MTTYKNERTPFPALRTAYDDKSVVNELPRSEKLEATVDIAAEDARVIERSHAGYRRADSSKKKRSEQS